MYTLIIILGWIAIVLGVTAIVLYCIGFVWAIVAAFMDD